MFKATLAKNFVMTDAPRVSASTSSLISTIVTPNMSLQESVAGSGDANNGVGGRKTFVAENIPTAGGNGSGDTPFLSVQKNGVGEAKADKIANIVMGKPDGGNQLEIKYQALQQSGETNFPTSRYSRKIFVGGLPPDIEEGDIIAVFRCFGPLYVDWPHKNEYYSKYPPKGYAFLIFQDERSVRNLIDACLIEDDKLYLYVSSISINNKPVQIRPWRLCDAECELSSKGDRDQRKTVFVGGVPRPMKAAELALIMNRLYGNVSYAAIDTDSDMKYPKGAGRVTFATQESYVKALSDRFVQLQHGDIDKRVEIKPFVLDNQQCDVCSGRRLGGMYAPFFCPNIACLHYYCMSCWAEAHTGSGHEFHRPLVKEGYDRVRSTTLRW